MGALLAFQSAPGADGSGGWNAAQTWIETQLGLRLQREAGTATRVAKFDRLLGPGTPLAESERGLLAIAGHWDHPGAGDMDELLALLERDGDAACDELDGSFVLVWHDGTDLIVLPEHCGRLHVYMAQDEAGVYVATSSVCLARAVGSEPDPLAAAEFLTSGNMYEERTPFLNVRRLRGARRYRFVGGRLAAETPVESFAMPPRGASGGDASTVLEACVSATRRLVEPYPRLLADLTGGLDSRLVAGLIRRSGHRFDVTVSGPAEHPDVAVAHSLARILGCPMIHEPEDATASPDFEQVRRAAILADGEVGAIDFAGVAAIKLKHAERFDGHVYGSGGEVFRNYWWQSRHLSENGEDPVELATPRFANSCLDPGLLQPGLFPGATAHFRAVVARTLENCKGRRLDEQMDHVYLYLRMESWQGAYASAANRIWPSVCPLMQRRVLRTLYALDPALRLDGRLIHDLIGMLGRDLANHPLETGFPPQRLAWRNAWRFLPGLAALPRQIWERLEGRRERRGAAKRGDAVAVKGLMESGAADFLAPGAITLMPFFDPPAYETFFERSRDGAGSRAVLGRLLALETVLRGR